MYQTILNFWFSEINSSLWWAKSNDLDHQITSRFAKIHQQAVRCELFSWRSSPQGRLAEIIILDQFSRNMFRGSSLSFANDALALALSQEAIAVGADKSISPIQRSFLYMPYMHSESLAIHQLAVELYKNNGIQANLEFELKHKEIIERFGRYPYRNEILGRASSQEEVEFLKGENPGF